MDIRTFSKRTVVLALVVGSFLITGCSSDSGGDSTPTGSVTALVGSTNYVSTSLTVSGSPDINVRTTSSEGYMLDLTFIGTSTGPFQFFNRGLSSGPGVAGGYIANGETYNIDSGSISISTYADGRIVATFTGTARGLLGATDLPVLNGMIDITF